MEGAIKSFKAETLLDSSNLRKYNNLAYRNVNDDLNIQKSRYYVKKIY